jgi:A118 family predicted phage portal protein
VNRLKIETIIEYLKKELGYEDLPSSYYKHIAEWIAWWRGFYKPFHQFTERGSDNRLIKRELYTLKMAKKVCEDWAAILLNEKTRIVIEDEKSGEFVQGKDSLGGVLGENDFWVLGNALVEKAFMSGTGAFVLRIDGMKVIGERIVKDKGASIRIEYLTADHIIPLSVRQGKIVDVAFVSEVLRRGKKYIYIETHILNDNNEYEITNRYFRDDEGKLIPEPLPEGIIESFATGSDIPLFSIVYPNIVNNIDDSNGLGISIFANAIDNLKGVDLAYNNFNRDLKLGGKKVFLNKSLVQYDEHGNTITPDDVAQQLFLQIGDEGLIENGNKPIQEYNPALRIQENKDAIQAQLDYLSFKVGFGTKHYQFNAGSVVTATQYMGDKQELIQNAAKHYIVIERALISLVRSILWIGKEVIGMPVNPDTKITINFEDSYIIDKESERQRDLQEVRDGLMQPYEFRMKWYGEDENTAKKMTGAALTDDELMGFDK